MVKEDTGREFFIYARDGFVFQICEAIDNVSVEVIKPRSIVWINAIA